MLDGGFVCGVLTLCVVVDRAVREPLVLLCLVGRRRAWLFTSISESRRGLMHRGKDLLEHFRDATCPGCGVLGGLWGLLAMWREVVHILWLYGVVNHGSSCIFLLSWKLMCRVMGWWRALTLPRSVVALERLDLGAACVLVEDLGRLWGLPAALVALEDDVPFWALHGS